METNDNSSPNTSSLVEDGLNKTCVFCTNCPSKILAPKFGTFVREEKVLPKMNQKKNAAEVETDLVEDCFQINDIFHFENVGFTHTLDKIKYLACSDCELGPIGWQDLESGKCYVALSRVRCVHSLSSLSTNSENANLSSEVPSNP